jgi:hypothetical protein
LRVREEQSSRKKMYKTMKLIPRLTLFLLVASFFYVHPAFAGDTTNTLIVAADIPDQNGLTVTLSKVQGSTRTAAGSLEFGNLVYNPEKKVFGSDSYYVLDVGINSNTADWALTHLTTSVSNGLNNLDSNINVTFMRQKDADNGTEIARLSYADSDKKVFKKAELEGGWLRIYYGIATGDPQKDAPGAKPVMLGFTPGIYKGKIDVTLTPS